MDYNEWISPIMELIREAGDKIMEIYEQGNGMNVSLKEDDSPVTTADLESNRILTQGLKKLTPEIPIVSEENKEVPYEKRKNFARFWIIDPIDGTKEFVNHLDEFTIHLALIEGEEVVLGFIFAPVFDEMYYAAKDQGSWSITPEGKKQLKGHEVNYKEEGVRIMRSRSNLDPKTSEYIENFDDPELITMGSGLKFTRLITGDADYYPRARTNMQEWDIAPAQIILEEAGGGIFEWNTGEPLRYNKENLKVTGFHAVSSGVLPED